MMPPRSTATPAHRVFRSDSLDRQFRSDGFVVVPLLDEGAASDLLHSWRSIDDRQLDVTLHPGVVGDDEAFQRRSWVAILDSLAEPASALLEDYRPIVGSFMVKPSAPGSAMRIHQDWCVVDERQWTSVSVWCPLVDTDEHNGALAVLPGSHRLRAWRGIGIPHSCRDLMDLPADRLTTLPMRAGDAVIYSHSLIHASGDNRSGSARVAAMMGMAPRTAVTIVCDGSEGDNRVRLLRTGPDFYFTYAFGREAPPPGLSVIAEAPAWPPIRAIDLDELGQ